MRSSRLLSILLLLQTRGRMSAPALAAELEVSVRTIYRDLEALSAAGVPVYAERGARGGYALLDGYRTSLTGLTGEEGAALALAGLPSAAAELGLGAVLAAAELKLSAALSADVRAELERVRERVHVDAPGWYAEEEPVPHLAAVAEAVLADHAVTLRYRRWSGEVTRTLAPLGLVVKGGRWYLVAASGDAVRTYRASRILALSPSDTPVRRPDGFDLAAWWAQASASLAGDLHRDTAVVRLSPDGVGLLPMLGAAAPAAPASAGLPDPDGWVRVEVPIESVDSAVRVLLGFGADAEVLEPPAVRNAMAAAAASLAARYRGEHGT